MALVGLAAGTFGAMVGMGGGVIMITTLVAMRKVGQHHAHGTSLVALVFTGIVGATTYALKGAVDVPAAISLTCPAMITARLGARFSHALPEWILRRSFGAFLVLVSVLLLLKHQLPGLSEPLTGWLRLVVLAAAGAGTGFLSGMFGIGGGSLMVPTMVLVVGLGQYVAQGSSLLAMVPTGVVGARTHWRLGNVAKHLLPGLIPGILVGAYLGASLAVALDERTLRIVFAGVLIAMSTRFIRTRRPAAAVPEESSVISAAS
jgi:hypothetical protein